MWVFGYGALMWDGWETEYGCVRREHAVALEHCRVFNKQSPLRWGTEDLPGLTLNLMPLAQEMHPCVGIAFEFPDERGEEIEAYLADRETCDASDIPVTLKDGEITARTYIYEGPRLVETDLPIGDRTTTILNAKGVAGSNYDYLANVRSHLESAGVYDHAVDELWHAIQVLRELSELR